MPTANSEWWRTKIGANKSRDRDTDRVLMQQGWMVLRVWEHEEPATAVDRIAATYHSRMNPVTVRRKLSN